MKQLHVTDLGPRQLWKLRKQIVLNSFFLADYENSYGIDKKECYDFFTGYVNWLEARMRGEVKGYNDDMFFDLLYKFDTYHELNEYAAAF